MLRRNRRHARAEVEVRVRVASIDPDVDPSTGESVFRDCAETCATLSAGGAFIPTPDPPEPGRRILLQIHVPGERLPVETLGRVAWAKRSLGPGDAARGAGIEFLSPEPRTERALRRYLAKHGASDR